MAGRRGGRVFLCGVVGALVCALVACGDPDDGERVNDAGGGSDVADTGVQTQFANLPTTVETPRGEQGSFEVEVSASGGDVPQLEVASNGCAFDVEIDADRTVSWICGADQPAECDVAIGVSGGSAQATLSLVCANRVPEVSSVVVSPGAPSLVSEIRCDYDFSDADSDQDASQIEWLRGEDLAGSGPIYAGRRAPGDVIRCRVTPDDGWDAGTKVASDGVTIGEASARLLGDFVQGAPGLEDVRFATHFGDAVYFQAKHEALGRELWRLDLTTQKTELVRDILDGRGDGAQYGPMQVHGSKLYFSADDGVHGAELWSTDGTTQGTVRVADAVPGRESGEARHLTVFDETLYFVTKEDGGYSSALWRIDPSTGQPESVLPSISGDPRLEKGVEFGGDLYVSGGTGYSDLLRLSASQGLTELPTTASGSDVGNLVATAQTIYFTKGRALWRSDGTASGTEMMSGFADVIDLLVYQGDLYISELSSSGSGTDFAIYRYSENDSQPSQLLGDFSTDRSSLYTQFLGQNTQGVIFMAPHPSEHSHTLWVTDGTTANTTQLLDDVYIDDVTREGEVLYFAGRPSSDNSFGLWRTDGTSAGTQRLASGYGRGTVGPLLSAAGGVVLVDPNERALLSEVMFPASSSPTRLSVDSLDLGSAPQEAALMGQDAIVSTRDGLMGYTLQHYDSQADSVSEVQHDLLGQAMALGQASTELTSAGDRVFFEGGTSDSRYLWWTDGTEEGTSYLSRTADGNLPERPSGMVALGDKVVFSGYDVGIAEEPWVSDGTEQGSKLLANISSSINGGSSPENFVRVGEQVYFLAEYTSNNQALWVTDGTSSGTKMVSSDLDFRSLREVDGVLYVGVEEGTTSRIGRLSADTDQIELYPELPEGHEAGEWAIAGGELYVIENRERELLWRLDDATYTQIDGELVSTHVLEGMVTVGERVFWIYYDRGFWSVRSAGANSVEATVIADQLPVEPRWMYPLDGRVIFESFENGASRLVISDGTVEGTRALLGASAEITNVEPLAHSTGGIFVSAYTSDHGQELWLIE